MAEIRQLTRRIQDLETTLQGSPLNGESVKKEEVALLEKRILELERTLSTYKGFLDEALSKIGTLEQKVVSLETKVCTCGSLAEETVETFGIVDSAVMTDNMAYLEEEGESEAAEDEDDA